MIKILFLVDDDIDDREVFQEAIIHCNPSIKLVFARDGIEALDYLESAQVYPDVIFLDYNMPRMNGVECLKNIKSNNKTNSIPIIMYTTSGDYEQEKIVLNLGADHYMRKTNSFTTLCDELNRLLSIISEKLAAVKK